MSNVPLMFQPLVKFVQFEGRSRRSEFWLWILFRVVLDLILGAVIFASIAPYIGAAGDIPEDKIMPMFSLIQVGNLVGLALLLPTLAVKVRRLHDIGRSGWWAITPWVVQIIGFTIFLIFFGASLFSMVSTTNGADPSDAQMLQIFGATFAAFCGFYILPSLIAQIVMLIFYVTDGTAGPNRFGVDPKGCISTSLSATHSGSATIT